MNRAMRDAVAIVNAAFASDENEFCEWMETMSKLAPGERIATFWWALGRVLSQREFVRAWRKASADLREART